MQNIVDIFEIALTNEVRARLFYAGAAEITEDGESQMVFIELTEMEEGHARLLVERFGEMLRAQGFDAAHRLEEIEAENAGGPGGRESELIRQGDMRSVVEFAIGMETRARDGYLELAGRVEKPELREFCEHLAAQEQDHHDTLARLRVSMDTPIDERPAL